MTPAPTTKIEADRPMSAPVKSLNQNNVLSNASEILATVRCLAADLVQQFNGGHPGTAMGAAATGLALWGGDIMRFNPKNPGWLDRDRFVLSVGHACLLQYMYLHLCGYESWTMDELKRYHSSDFRHSQSAGHPEREFEGIEVTTGPLGQGIANAVGLAMASKHFAAVYNRPGHEVVQNKIWCMTGDGCIQEGIGQEAISLAGHLGLDNLILVYDNNRVTVDGNIDICFTDDTSAKVRACGWHVVDVLDDATNDVAAIVKALQQGKNNSTGKPVFINIRTTIGFGSLNEGKCPTHGAALGNEDVGTVKKLHNRDPNVYFDVPDSVYQSFLEVQERGARLEQEWTQRLAAYRKKCPELANDFEIRFNGKLSVDASLLPPKSELPTSPIPTRKASGIAMQTLAPVTPEIMAGSADLLESTFISWKGMKDFQSPASRKGGFDGRQIHYGIREHAMAGIANGLAAYHDNAILPVISTFFMFFLYAAPAIRMSALQRLRFVGIATHDAIGIGADGPTHQPIGLASLFRSVPNICFMRPGDAEEVLGAWSVAVSQQCEGTPVILSLSRQAVPLLANSDRKKVAFGAYAVREANDPEIVLIATGAEVAVAEQVADLLAPTRVRVVSMPCQGLFDKQSKQYKRNLLPTRSSIVIAIEAWSSYGWARYAHASISMHTFGLSGPQEDLYPLFGFAPDNVAAKIRGYLQTLHVDGVTGKPVPPPVGEFEELLLDYVA